MQKQEESNFVATGHMQFKTKGRKTVRLRKSVASSTGKNFEDAGKDLSLTTQSSSIEGRGGEEKEGRRDAKNSGPGGQFSAVRGSRKRAA